MNKYLVTFRENAKVQYNVVALVTAKSENDIKECLNNGDYDVQDQWEIDCLDTEIEFIDNVELLK